MIERFNFLKPFESSMEYPKEYNPRVHGPYNPSIYYGAKDTPFGETKIKDLVSWVLRREKSAASVSGLVNRGLKFHFLDNLK
jgi:hypothetical protein